MYLILIPVVITIFWIVLLFYYVIDPKKIEKILYQIHPIVIENTLTLGVLSWILSRAI